MINTIFNWLCAMNILTVKNEDEKEVYLYALDIVVYTFINATVILIASLFVGCFWQSVLFLLLFSLFQTKGGGFHASSHIGCIISTFVTWVLYVLMIKLIPSSFSTWTLCITVACVILLFFIGPTEHPNAPKTQNQYKKHKKQFYILFALISIIQCLLCFTLPNIFVLIAYIIILYFISVVTAFFINKK